MERQVAERKLQLVEMQPVEVSDGGGDTGAVWITVEVEE